MAELVVRQHARTRVREVEGSYCQEFGAVVGAAGRHVGPVYYRGDDRWHRFFLDAGLLFWQEGARPDEDGELLDGERYSPWGQELGVIGARLSLADMADGELVLRFDNGASVRIFSSPRSDGAALRELRRAS